MVMGVAVAEGLAGMPPGPGLAGVLGGIDPLRVPNDDVVDVLIAESRQLAHQQARVWAAVCEVIHRRPFAGPLEIRRGEAPEVFGADEVRAALAWTRRYAERESDLAYALVECLPAVFAALLRGEIDRGRAQVCAQHLGDLTPAQIEAVCRVLLPIAGRLTTGELAARLRRMIIQIDPQHYERRYRKAVRDRSVIGYLDANGTATISATGLPAEEAAAALERIDDLARAVRRAGHPATLDQLRADVVLGLLDGSLHHLTRDQIIDTLLNRGADPDPDPEKPEEPAARTGDQDAAAQDAAGQDAAGQDAAGQGGTDPGGAEQDRTTPAGTAGSPAGSTAGGTLDGAATDRTLRGAAGGVVEDQRVAVEVRVALSTLLHLDEHPGEIPGLGPLTAGAARRTVARQRRAQWRYAVTDTDGRLISEGITRPRPAYLPRGGPRGGIVELHVPAAALHDLTAASASGPWAAVVADIAAQHRAHDPPSHLRDLDAHPRDRFPRTALRRHVQIRDRVCTYPGCRHPASRADQDHTLDHATGGTTTSDDLSPACRHDHTLKTEGGWQLHQPEPGSFVWTSPLGHTYPTQPEPILPPQPDPAPREHDPWFDQPAEDTDEPLHLHTRGRAPPAPSPDPTRPEPAAEQPVDINDEPPPF